MESVESLYNFDNKYVKTQVYERLKDYDDDVVVSEIARLILIVRPQNEKNLEVLLKDFIITENRESQFFEVLGAAREVYHNMLYMGFQPSTDKQISEGRARWEEKAKQMKLKAPEIIMHHDRKEDYKVDIFCNNVTISIGGVVICEDAEFKINYGRRYVLIGRNGLGKTTILNAIATREIEGIPKHLQILHVEQETVANDNTLLQEILMVDIERTKLLKELEEITKKLEEIENGTFVPEIKETKEVTQIKEDETSESTVETNFNTEVEPEQTKQSGKKAYKPKNANRKNNKKQVVVVVEKEIEVDKNSIEYLTQRYKEISNRLAEIGFEEAETNAIAILSGLGFSNSDLTKKTKHFSGGWRMRISLAKALFAKPDILLLDEPTNHLDMHTVMWLENYLNDWPYTIVIVSHARSFINNVATDVINFTGGKFIYYKGNYDDYVKAKTERNRNLTKIRDYQLKKIEHVQEFIDKFRANAKRASLVQSRIKMVSKIEVEEEILEDPSVIFVFPEVSNLAPPLLKLNNVSLGYDKKKIVINKSDFYVDMDSRIAIVGPNGAGKSTLMKCLYNQLQALEGVIYRHPKLRVALFTQHHIDQLDLDMTPVEAIASLQEKDEDKMKYEDIRQYLSSFGITGALAIRPIYMLSGGQKSRVALAALVLPKPHIILMDEPTNHMDIDSVNALGVALSAYDGGIVLISHDEYFVESVCNQIYVVNNQKCERYEGTFMEYRKLVRKELGNINFH